MSNPDIILTEESSPRITNHSVYKKFDTNNFDSVLIDNQAASKIKPKKYKPLNMFFINKNQEPKENAICDEILRKMAPNTNKVNAEGKFELDYNALTAEQVISLVSHYVVNVLMPFFNPENRNEKDLYVMPLSEEFVEPCYSFETMNSSYSPVFESMQYQKSYGGICGCFDGCIPKGKKNQRNASHY